ncbi:DNA polymerase III [Paenibacillus sp. IB182496]|uniref:DNA polymerase III n=1 Tax=Paenibacillus sabuli TaxID=2772509 RepID=A0A927GQ07_9BACL|nr:3'-5' exonuclease [Paenibacillus sabuli]MBD2843873.1 DNA polymerase III [Paenibacillus sabuli]
MQYIVMDIEFNGRKFASELPMEVIEIGAVRLDEQLRLTGEFSSLIKPRYFAKLNSFIRKKTGIPQEGIDAADNFPKVIGAFRRWLGDAADGKDTVLVTWGGEDLKRIVFDTRMHKLDDSQWLSTPYFDLLKGYLRCKGLTNDVSPEKAMEELGIEASGNAHRALDDAKMTAEIFRAVFDQLDLSQQQHYKDVFTNAKERRFVKQAIRTIRAQKAEPKWETVTEQFLRGKVPLDDARKMAELREVFDAERARPARPAKSQAQAQTETQSKPQPPAQAHAQAQGKSEAQAQALSQSQDQTQSQSQAQSQNQTKSQSLFQSQAPSQSDTQSRPPSQSQPPTSSQSQSSS